MRQQAMNGLSAIVQLGHDCMWWRALRTARRFNSIAQRREAHAGIVHSDLFNPEGVQIESLFRAESAGVFLVPQAESADSTHGSDDRETQFLAHARKEQQSKTHKGKRTLHKSPLGLFAKA
jgi:hypothetical protein